MKKSNTRITHIIEATATGTLSMAVLLANSQARAGSHVSIIYSRRPETPSNLEMLFLPEITLKNIQMSSLFEKLASLLEIRRTLKLTSPTSVFMHSSFGGFLGRVASIRALSETKFFYIPHCISFMRKDIGPLKSLAFSIFEWIGSIKKADYIACSNSELVAITARIPFRKCHLIENAINYNEVPTTIQTSLSGRKKSVITVGQIRAQKGPEAFSAIAQAVKAIDSDVEFFWVGDGDTEARQQLESAGVKVIGWVPKKQVWEHLCQAQLYLSTAKWEGMPVSIIEASFAGLPVIASRCSGNIDVIEHSKTGWLFQSVPEATQYIITALNDHDLASSQAKAAFDLAQKRFSVERYIDEMNTITNPLQRSTL